MVVGGGLRVRRRRVEAAVCQRERENMSSALCTESVRRRRIRAFVPPTSTLSTDAGVAKNKVH